MMSTREEYVTARSLLGDASLWVWETCKEGGFGAEGTLCPSILQGASFGGGTEPQGLFLGSLPQQLGTPSKLLDLSVMRARDCPPHKAIIRIMGNR